MNLVYKLGQICVIENIVAISTDCAQATPAAQVLETGAEPDPGLKLLVRSPADLGAAFWKVASAPGA